MPVAIRANQLSKRYRIPRSGVAATSPLTSGREPDPRFRAVPLAQSRGRQGLRRVVGSRTSVSRLRLGEVVGIVGRNGAGKSTLLRSWAASPVPRGAAATIRGRVGTLLEVGTGFHPELNGRENIFLSGSILGMTHPRDQTKIRRDRRLRRDRALSGPAGQALFQRHVRASGVRRRRLPRAGDPAGRRGSGRRRRRVPEKMPVTDGEPVEPRADGPLRQPQHGGDPPALSAEHSDRPRPGLHDGPTPETLRRYHELLRKITVDSDTGLRDRLARCTGAVRFTEISVEKRAGEKEWDFRTGESIRIRFACRAFEAASDLRFYLRCSRARIPRR